MDGLGWSKQSADKPLFPDLLWSRPERRDQAGKLLIIGGNLHGFSAAAEAYQCAAVSGIGTSRVLLPKSLKPTVGKLFPEAEYVPSTPSGSFARAALSELLEAATWSDGVLLAGDVGHNSETALLIESFANKYTGQLTITQDVAEYIITSPLTTINRADTLIVVSIGQLQKLAKHLSTHKAITQAMGLPELTAWLADFTQEHTAHIITKHLDQIIVAVNGQVSTTACASGTTPWRVKTAAQASVWWLQHPNKPFEALTTSVLA